MADFALDHSQKGREMESKRPLGVIAVLVASNLDLGLVEPATSAEHMSGGYFESPQPPGPKEIRTLESPRLNGTS